MRADGPPCSARHPWRRREGCGKPNRSIGEGRRSKSLLGQRGSGRGRARRGAERRIREALEALLRGDVKDGGGSLVSATCRVLRAMG